MQLLIVSSKAGWTDDGTNAYGTGCFIGHDVAPSDASSASVDSR